MNDNNIKGVIAEDSFYAPSKDIIERMIAGETSLKHQSDQEAYAKKVVKHITSSNPSAQFFAGKQSTSLWLLDTFTWHTIWASNLLPTIIPNNTDLLNRIGSCQA